MTNHRPSVPRNVERKLWSESIGVCMNPDCQERLIDDSAGQSRNIGEMAHIIPHAKGGEISAENMILLCSNCHQKTEPLRIPEQEKLLRGWKERGITRNKKTLSRQFSSYRELEDQIKPLLLRNQQIFESYGPNLNSPEMRNLWLHFENEIIVNNARLRSILDVNKRFFHENNKKIIDEFILHIDEFIKTREDQIKIRSSLFPVEILYMFGIEYEDGYCVQNVSAVQNFVSSLKNTNKLIDFQIMPNEKNGVISYRQDDDVKTIYLSENRRMLQILFSGHLYSMKRTELKFDNLFFFLNWLTEKGIKWIYEDSSDLTVLIVEGKSEKYKVILFYSYCLSLNDLQSANVEQGCLIVNLHMWNQGPSSEDAKKYAQELECPIFNQNQFFVFCHRNCKK